MTDEPTEAVDMTLDESGMLHNILTKAFLDLGMFSRALTPQERRLYALYERIGVANDKLMGRAV